MISFEDYFNDIRLMTHSSNDSQNGISLWSVGFSSMKQPIEVAMGKGHYGARVDISKMIGNDVSIAEFVSTVGGYHGSLDVGSTMQSLKWHTNANWKQNGGETAALINTVALGNVTGRLSCYVDPTSVRAGRLLQAFYPTHGSISATMGNFKIGSKIKDRYINDYGILYEAKKRNLIRLPRYCRPCGLNKLTVALAFGDGNNNNSVTCRGVGIAGVLPLPNPRIGVKGEFKSCAVAAYVENDELSAAVGFSPLESISSNLTTKVTASPNRLSGGIQAAVLSPGFSVSISADLPSVQQLSTLVVCLLVFLIITVRRFLPTWF